MSKKWAYYNEFDPKAAAWLRKLIEMGQIMDGEVDERSIRDVRADDVRGFFRCHWFAGIAGWEIALRRAGVDADRALWTGSCPCQAFSCAGQQKGFSDERDLWPVFFNLIRECRPELVLGEQVANAVKFGWLDRLYADLEGEGYACGSPVLGAHSAGADHIRQRIYWVADTKERGSVAPRSAGEHGSHRTNGLSGGGESGDMADASLQRLDGRAGMPEQDGGRESEANGSTGVLEDTARIGRGGRGDGDQAGVRRALQAAGSGGSGWMGVAEIDGCEMRLDVHGELRGEGSVERRGSGWMGSPIQPGLQGHAGNVGDGCQPGRLGAFAAGPASTTDRARNFWSDAVPHLCKDGKYRRFEPRIFPLAHGLPRGMGYSGDPRLPEYVNSTAEARVMRLKGYGNSVCVETAAMFVRAVMDELEGKEVIA